MPSTLLGCGVVRQTADTSREPKARTGPDLATAENSLKEWEKTAEHVGRTLLLVGQRALTVPQRGWDFGAARDAIRVGASVE